MKVLQSTYLMKKSVVIILIFVGGIFAWHFWGGDKKVPPKVAVEQNNLKVEEKNTISQVQITGKNIKVEIADTDAKREKGLSGHALLKDDEGMLFIFDHPSKYGFWMKDMLFPIDIIWMTTSEMGESNDLQVVFIEKNAQPSSYPTVFEPSNPANYVLEVNAGFSEKNNLQVGNRVEFLPF